MYLHNIVHYVLSLYGRTRRRSLRPAGEYLLLLIMLSRIPDAYLLMSNTGKSEKGNKHILEGWLVDGADVFRARNVIIIIIWYMRIAYNVYWPTAV